MEFRQKSGICYELYQAVQARETYGNRGGLTGEAYGKNKREGYLKMDKEDRTNPSNKEPIILIAFYTACCAIIVINATFLGDILRAMVANDAGWLQRIFFFSLMFAIVSLNIAEIINNWVSIKKYFKCYHGSLLLIDILTLGIFFWQIYTASGIPNNSGPAFIDYIRNALPILIFPYFFVFMCYTAWNCMILNRLEKSEEKAAIKAMALFRGLQAAGSLACFCISMVSFNKFIISLVFYMVFSFFVVSRNNKKTSIFDTLTKPLEQ